MDDADERAARATRARQSLKKAQQKRRAAASIGSDSLSMGTGADSGTSSFNVIDQAFFGDSSAAADGGSSLFLHHEEENGIEHEMTNTDAEEGNVDAADVNEINDGPVPFGDTPTADTAFSFFASNKPSSSSSERFPIAKPPMSTASSTDSRITASSPVTIRSPTTERSKMQAQPNGLPAVEEREGSPPRDVSDLFSSFSGPSFETSSGPAQDVFSHSLATTPRANVQPIQTSNSPSKARHSRTLSTANFFRNSKPPPPQQHAQQQQDLSTSSLRATQAPLDLTPLRIQITTQQTTINTLNAEKTGLENEIESLKAQLAGQQDTSGAQESFQRQEEAVREQHESHTQSLVKQFEQERRTLHESMQTQVESMQLELAAAKDQCRQVEQAQQAAEQRCLAQQADLDQCRSDLQEARLRCEVLEGLLSSKRMDISAVRETSEHQLASLRSELDAAAHSRGGIHANEKDEELRKTREALEKTEKALKERNFRIKGLEVKFQRQEKEAIDARKEYDAKITAAQQAHTETRERINQREEERATNNASNGTQTDAQQMQSEQLARVHEAYESLRREHADLQASIAAKARETHDEHETALSGLRNQLESLRKEHAQDLAQFDQQTREWQNKIALSHTESQTKDETVEEVRSELDRLRSEQRRERDESSARISQLSNEIAAERNSRAEAEARLTSENDSLRNRLAQSTQESSETKVKFDQTYVDDSAEEHEMNLSHARSQIRSLESNLFDQTAKANRAARKIVELEEDLMNAARKYAPPPPSSIDDVARTHTLQSPYKSPTQERSLPTLSLQAIPPPPLDEEKDGGEKNDVPSELSVSRSAFSPTSSDVGRSPASEIRAGHHRRATTTAQFDFLSLSSRGGLGSSAETLAGNGTTSLTAARRMQLLKKASAIADARRKAKAAEE